MKKLLISIIGLFIFITSLSVNTYAKNYDQVAINDNTSIEADFEILGLEYDDYYKIDKYNDYDKFYVVAMAEAYLKDSGEIQTYLYLYNPSANAQYQLLNLSYLLNNVEYSYSFDNLTLEASSNGLYKVKGFKYNYTSKADIVINGLSYLNYVYWLKYSESNFKTTNTHDLNDVFSVEANFNTLLIIEDYNVVSFTINDDDTLWDNFKEWFNGTETYLNLYFYNFNFPDHVDYDSVEYAKFSYTYKEYYKRDYASSIFWKDDFIELLSTESVVREYYPDVNYINVEGENISLSFSTFYLGNRYIDDQFSSIPEFSGDTKKFDVDCSVLLDYTYTEKSDYINEGALTSSDWGEEYYYKTLDDVQMLELHYQNDGVVYQAQIISDSVDEDDFSYFETKNESDIDKLLDLIDDMLDWFSTNWGGIVLIAIGVIILVVVAPVLFPLIVDGIKSLFKTIIDFFKSLFKKG